MNIILVIGETEMKAKISEIKVAPDRARKKYVGLLELAESIKTHGLIHPLVVEPVQDGTYNFRLVAGCRRLKACIISGITEVDITLRDETDDITRKEIELEENLHRADLSWLEKSQGVKQLDELKRKKYGSATQSRESKGWGQKETAVALGRSVGSVNEDIQLATDMEENPELLKKVEHLPKHAAKRYIKQAKEAKKLQRQVERRELVINADLRLGDCCELIDDIENESVHLWLTDPPFGIKDIMDQGISGHKTMTYALTESNVDTEENMRKIYNKLLPKIYKKMAPGCHIYVFHAPGWYCELLKLLRKYGFDVGEVAIIWDKMRTSIVGKCLHYTASHECIFFGRKPPNTRLLKKPIRDVLSIPAISPQLKTHSLQKPDELIRTLIENSTDVGELVLDTFAGSGQTLVTANKMQRRAIGFELDKDNFLRAQSFMRKELGT